MTEYWKNRFLKTTKDIFDSNDQYVAEIFRMYKGAAENIDKDILGILNSMEEVSMSEAKKLLNKKEVKGFRNNLSDFKSASKGFITPDLEKELDVASRRVRISRLQAMQLSLKSNVAVMLNKEQKKLFAHLSNQYTSSYYEDLYELQRITGYEQINKLSSSFVEEVLNTSWANDGKNFSDRIWARKDKLISTLDTNLRQGLITGRSPDKISAEISHELNTSKSNAKRLVQTESAAIHASSRKSMFKQMGVEKYEILATLDTRTTEICRGLDGKVFNVKDYEVGITAPPFHVYCRSTTIPYFDDDIQDEIVERRAARNVRTGKSTTVPDMTYKTWFKRYVQPVNDEKEFKRILKVLGYPVVENLDKYRSIKYNDVERYEQINREANTMEMIDKKDWSDPFKKKMKKIYYDFRENGHELNIHGLERTNKRILEGKFTEKEVLEVLNKDFNKRQIVDDRPVKFYNGIQAVYLDDEIEILNVLKRSKTWKEDEKLYDYNK